MGGSTANINIIPKPGTALLRQPDGCGRVIVREHYAPIMHFTSTFVSLLTRTHYPYYPAINTGKEVVG
jgi:hypothetical protein